MITLKNTLKNIKVISLTQLAICGACAHLWSAGGARSKYADLMPYWTEQIDLLEAVEPKLEQKDRTLFKRVSPHLQSNPEQAIQEIQSSSSETRSPIFDFWLGHLLLSQGKSESAKQALSLCVRKFPNFRKAHRTLANLFAQKGDHVKAREHALKVIQLGGTDSSVYGLLAYTYFEDGHFQSALSAYRMASMFKPDHLSFRKGELYCLAELQQNEEVISLCEELLAFEPNHKQNWLLQMNALLKLERPLEAIAILEILQHKGLAQQSELNTLGQLYFNEECYPKAVETFTAAMATGASVKSFIRPLNALIGQGHHQEAQILLTATRAHYSIEILSSEELWLLAEVQLLLIAGAEEQAETKCRQLLQRWPMSESGLMTLAQHLARKGDVDESRFFFERAALLEKVQVRAWRELGRLAWSDGDAHSAIQWLEKVDQAQPSMEMKETIKRLRDRL
jgi:tetratricopeptide (TPR) repeat protein